MMDAKLGVVCKTGNGKKGIVAIVDQEKDLSKWTVMKWSATNPDDEYKVKSKPPGKHYVELEVTWVKRSARPTSEIDITIQSDDGTQTMSTGPVPTTTD